MKNLRSMLVGAGVGLATFLGSLFIPYSGYSQNISSNKQDTMIQQTTNTNQTNKKEKVYYSDVAFSVSWNSDKDLDEMLGPMYGFKINGGRRFLEEIKAEIGLDYKGKKKKHDYGKDKLNKISIDAGVFWSPWAKKVNSDVYVDPFSFGGGVKLNLNEFEFSDQNNKDSEKVNIFDIGYFVRAGAQIKPSKKGRLRINFGIEYNVEKTRYQGDPLDLSNITTYLGFAFN